MSEYPWNEKNKIFTLLSSLYNPFKRQPHKMVKHNKIVRRQNPMNCLNVFDHFVGLALKGLKFQNLRSHDVIKWLSIIQEQILLNNMGSKDNLVMKFSQFI